MQIAWKNFKSVIANLRLFCFIFKYFDVLLFFNILSLLSTRIICCGCRVVGAAPVADLHSAYSRQDALGAGIRLLLGKDNIQSVDKLTVIALMLI